jgi:hypothetical protein
MGNPAPIANMLAEYLRKSLRRVLVSHLLATLGAQPQVLIPPRPKATGEFFLDSSSIVLWCPGGDLFRLPAQEGLARRGRLVEAGDARRVRGFEDKLRVFFDLRRNGAPVKRSWTSSSMNLSSSAWLALSVGSIISAPETMSGNAVV